MLKFIKLDFEKYKVMETLFLIVHLLSNVALVSALFVQLAIINSKEQGQVQLRKKVSNLVAHPAMILGAITIVVIFQESENKNVQKMTQRVSNLN